MRCTGWVWVFTLQFKSTALVKDPPGTPNALA